ncbi:hypothetical protein [uncultured Phycicoccus sp.]|uniref:hypothetical protein n=1 Tax=uncultured Phycicoccus sp. TaxID=661422 RepID=UPI002622001F|nr:hypothetical protein [uncultured Phycicoccus sp.]
MATTFRLRAGDTGPVQQSPVTCGSACLTVARMLVDPVFASWVRTGEPHPPGSPSGATQAERFAAYERVVMRRTNGLVGAGRVLSLPWPRALGTPPWGAKHELEFGASRRGTEYELDVLRGRDEGGLLTGFDRLVDVVADGEPALLYIGNRLLPRHVVLVLPGDGDRMLDVYDPATGRVDHLRRDTVVERRIGLSGWDVPWLAVRPTGLRRVEDRSPARNPRPMPA